MTSKCAAIANLIIRLGSEGTNARIDSNRLVISLEKEITAEDSAVLIDLFTAFGQNSSRANITVDSTSIESIEDITSALNNREKADLTLAIFTGVDDPIYLDIGHFKHKWTRHPKWPNEFYFFDRHQLFTQATELPDDLREFKNNSEFIKSVLDSISQLCHHQSKSGGAIYIDTKENSTPSIEIATAIDEIFLDQVDALERIHAREDFLHPILEEKIKNSMQSLKEIAVFRNSIFEFFKSSKVENNSVNMAIFLLENFDNLKEIFTRNYQTFVNGLSLEKIRAELVSEQMKFTDQATKNLMETTNKMFVLPGVTVLGKLLTNDATVISKQIVNAGILITSFILGLIIFVQIFQINTLKESKDEIFSDFSNKLREITSIRTIQNLNKIIRRMSYTILMVKVVLISYLVSSIVVFFFYLYQFWVSTR